MFGGLDIKGGGGSNSNNNDASSKAKDNNNNNNASTVSSASSAFSFLNPSSTPPTTTTTTSSNAAMKEHTTAVTSAFSFLSLDTDNTANTKTTTAPPAMSAFSFLQQPTPSSDEREAATTSTNTTTNTVHDSPASSLSAFGFLTTSTTSNPVTTAVAPLATTDEATPSAFSFLTSPTPAATAERSSSSSTSTTSALATSFGASLLSTTPTSATSNADNVIPAPSTTTTTTTSSSNNNTTTSTSYSSLSNWEDHLVTANPSVPLGSGIVFGGAVTLDAAISSKKTIKKRNRVSRVGVGANVVGTSNNVATPESPHHKTTASASAADTSNNQTTAPPTTNVTARNDIQEDGRPKHREEAQEATWRAEQFLREKIMETANKNAAMLEQQQAHADNTPVEFTRTKSTSSYRSDQQNDGEDLDEEDDVVAAAKAAAEEARHLSSSSSSLSARQRSLGDRLGGFFKGKSWGQNSGVGTPSLVHSTSANSWLAAGGKSADSSNHGELTAVERIQREQEEIKRAMAERQLVMQQFQQQQQQQQQQYPPRPSAGETELATTAKLAQTATREFEPPTPPEPSTSVVAPQPPVPPPPPPKTPMDLFDEIMSNFHTKVEQAMERVGQLRQQRAMLLEERFITLAKERLASQQMAQAEAQQQAAAETEDFDLADQMGTVLEKHSRERAELDAILVSIGRALEQLEKQRVQVVGAVAECFVEVRSCLKKFQKEQLQQESKDDTDAMKKFSAVAKQLSAENERLQQDLKHLERDETLVAEERKELETAILEHSGEFETQRNEAMEKLQHVEEEIEELRKCLAAKEAVAEELRNEVKSQDEAIGKIRVKFSRQLLRVQTKEATLKENRQEWENEKAAFERQKDSHETEVQDHSQSLLKHEELMSKLKNEISLAGTFERIVSKEIGFDDCRKDNEEADGDLAQMHSEVVKCEAAVSKALDVLKAANSTLTALEEEHKTLIARIPELETEKKAAAARRDFKAAGKASKEIKDATIRLKECEQELTCEAAERQKAAEEELKKLQAELEEKRTTTNAKEKESGDAAMLVLAQKIKDLIATKKRICGNASGASVQGIGAFVLHGQIDTLKLEGQSLGSKYGGWDSLLAEIESIESAETQEVDADTAKEAAKDYGELDTEASGSDNGGDTETPDTQCDQVVEAEAPQLSSSKDRIAKFKDLTCQLKDAEESLEKAVAREDYDEAAELDVVFQSIQRALEDLDLTDDEMESAMGSDNADVATDDTNILQTPASETMTEVEVPHNENAKEEFATTKEIDVADELPESVDHTSVQPETVTGATTTCSDLAASDDAQHASDDKQQNGQVDRSTGATDDEKHESEVSESAVQPLVGCEGDSLQNLEALDSTSTAEVSEELATE